jgi:hypothetical protein
MPAFGKRKTYTSVLDPSRKWFYWASIVPTLAVSDSFTTKRDENVLRGPFGIRLALSRDLSAQEPSMFSRALLCILCCIIAR